MFKFSKTRYAKSIAGVVGLVAGVFMLFGVVGTTQAAGLTTEQIDQIVGLLSVFGADATIVANVRASLTGGTPVVTPPVVGTTACTFTASLTLGSKGAEVTCLQNYLTGTGHFTFSGGATGFFGPVTQAAVAAWQAANGVTPAVGYFGPISQAKYTAIAGVTPPVDPGDPTPTPTPGTGLTVSAGVQPAVSLAPGGVSRLPFTKFTVTAGADGDVVMNSVTVERVGLGVNANFAGVVLLDENGAQYGLSKTLNSNNQAVIGEDVTIPAGQSRTFTVAGNMASSLGAYAGQVVGFNVVGINTSATVVGALPISGANHTINGTLSVGTVTAQRGSLDPNTSPNKEVGTTGYTFASVTFTAGSSEDVTFKSIRWNQSGSAAKADLANVMIVLDGTSYPAVVSTDGKYYSASFGSGVTISKGLSKEVSIKGDIVSGSNRGVDFDIYRDTDAHFVGNTFGYGLTPTIGSNNDTDTTSDDSEFNDGTNDGGTPPWYDGREVTVGTGSLNVSVSNNVPAGNIADGASSVPLGAFEFDVRGESVTWSSLAITIATTSGSGTDGGELLTNITLVDSNGAVIAGPQDPNTAGSTVTISDTVTLPVGKHVLIVKGNLNNSWENNDTIALSFTPSTAISTVSGGVSGQTITPTPAATVTGKTQTVSSGSLTVTPASSLVDANVIDNSTNVVLGRYILDANSSGEDVRVTTVQIEAVTGTNADLDELNSLYLYDVTGGADSNITSSTVNNPSGNTGGADATLTFTIDSNALTVPKGTQKIIELRGTVNASSTPTSTTTFTMDFADGTLTSDWTVTGKDTGKTISESLGTGAGATLTVVGAGTLTASLDSADPAETWRVPGSEITVGVLNFKAVNEDMRVTDLGLLINTASSSAADVQTLKLYDGNTLVKSITSPAFTGGKELITFTEGSSSALNTFVVPKGDDGRSLTIKAIFSKIGTGFAGTSGNLFKVSTTTTASENKAKGASSGTAVDILGSAATSTGARYFKSVPVVAKLAVPSTILSNGTKTLYKFSVTADAAGKIDLYKFSFTIATTSANADSFSLVETTTGNTVFSSVESLAGVVEGVVSNSTYGATQITLNAGETRTYELKATITNAGTAGDTVQVTMNGDAAHISAATNGLSASNVDGDTNDDFIWSDRSNSSHTTSTADWYNGYKVLSFNGSDLDTEVISQ